MKAVSIHFAEGAYQEMKSLAAQRGRPVAELIRQAMEEYLQRERGRGGSVLERQAHESGRLLKGWTREEIFDEMLDA